MKRVVSCGFGPVFLTVALLTLSGFGTAFAGGMYDGTYHGTLTGVGMNATSCAKSAPIQMTVTDSKLEYIHMGHGTITATVGADGSFSGTGTNAYSAGGRGSQQQQTLTLAGKISVAAILAETKVGNSCTYKLELKRFK
jgi:hypothetical protein